MRLIHPLKWLRELIGIVIAGLVVLTVLLLWRLSLGPMKIDFLRPFIEKNLAQETNLPIAFDDLWVSWHGFEHPLQIEFSNITLLDQAGQTAIQADRGELRLASQALLIGHLRPIGATLVHPKLRLIRAEDGTLSLGLGGKDSSLSLRQLMEEIRTPPAGSVFSHWADFGFRDAEITAEGSDHVVFATISDTKLTIIRARAGLNADFSASLKDQNNTTQLSASAMTNPQTGQISVKGAIEGLVVSSLQKMNPIFADLTGIDVPVTLMADLTLEKDLSVNAGHFTLVGSPGILNRPELFDKPLPFSSGHLTLTYAAAPERLDVTEAILDLGGANLSLKAAISSDKDTISFEGSGGTNGIPLDRFADYWPKTIAVGGRSWVTENLSHGVATATYHVNGTVPKNDLSAFDIQDVSGVIKVSDAVIHYFGALPVVEEASADIAYDKENMKIAMKGGHTQNLLINDGMIVISGLNKSEQSIAIDLVLNGPIATSLKIIDADPLHYARKLKIDPSTVIGSAQTKLHMGFPLLAALSVDDIDLTANATLTGLGIQNLVQSHALTDTNASLKLNTDGVDLEGKGLLDQVALSFQLHENFKHQNGLDSDINVQAIMENADRERFGFAAPERLNGPVSASLHYRDFGATASADILADLTTATFKIDEIAYEKSIGKPGKALFTLALVNDRLEHIDNILVTAPDFKASGNAKLDPDTGHLQNLAITGIRTGATRVSVLIKSQAKGDEIDIKGASLDVGPLLSKKHTSETHQMTVSPTPTFIKFNVEHLVSSPDHQADQLKGSLTILGKHWVNANLQMQTHGQPVSLTYGPEDQTSKPLKLRMYAADTGALLSALSLTDTMQGGTLHIDGKKDGTPNDFTPLNGNFALDGFTLVKAPILARLFNVLSLTGMMETLSGQGIRFDGLMGTYQLTDDTLSIRDGRLRGSSLGMTIEGQADRTQSMLDFQGTVVPAYTANQFLNAIPVLGPILTGGEGEGLFAAAYHITGPFDKPDVSVNPLSILTPGFLRNLFFERSLPEEVK